VVLCVGVLAFANLATVVPFFSLCPAAERDLAETDWLGISLVLIGAVSLAWRRRAPMAVLAITAAAFCGSLLLGYPPAQPLAPMIALFALAVVHSSLVTAAAGAVAGLVIVTATATYLHWRADFDDRPVIAGRGVPAWLRRSAQPSPQVRPDRTGSSSRSGARRAHATGGAR
jgi:hypothetical protein